MLSKTVYAAWNKNDIIRRNSSSGGVFYSLGEKIIRNGGTVVGAAYDANNNVSVEIVDDLDNLKRLCGSKYIQADTNNTFVIIKEKLDLGETILFSGTPCLCNALVNYLGKEYERLFIADIICHGVPTKGVWERYKKYVADSDKIVSVDFRDKRNGWNEFGISIQFKSGVTKFTRRDDDPYMRLFLKNISLRPSCYYCDAKNNKRMSDITLGDFWGYSSDNHDEHDGVSAVIVNTDKGKMLLDECGNIVFKEKSMQELISHNKYYVYTPGKPIKRKKFFKDFERELDVFGNSSQYCKISFQQRIYGRVLKELKKIWLLRNKKYILELKKGKRIENIKEKCTGCCACMNVCQHGAIKMEQDREGAVYPIIDKKKCIKCGRCESVCGSKIMYQAPLRNNHKF